MTRLLLIPTAQTDWYAQGRFAGDLDLPLNEAGRRQAAACGKAIAPLGPTVLVCGPEQATKQTATLVGKELGLKPRTVKRLRELNLGHWEGLTVEDFKDRFPKVYKQWRSNPLSVEPPEGEPVSEAATRLVAQIGELARKNGEALMAVAVGRFAFAILICKLLDGTYNAFWDHVDEPPVWREVALADESGGPAPATPAKRDEASP